MYQEMSPRPKSYKTAAVFPQRHMIKWSNLHQCIATENLKAKESNDPPGNKENVNAAVFHIMNIPTLHHARYPVKSKLEYF